MAKHTPFGMAVFVEKASFGRPLRMRRPDLVCGSGWNSSPEASIELARAILLDAGGDELLADRLGKRFSSEVLESLPIYGFRLSREEVLEWIGAHSATNIGSDWVRRVDLFSGIGHRGYSAVSRPRGPVQPPTWSYGHRRSGIETYLNKR